jgi:hypothetical protein
VLPHHGVYASNETEDINAVAEILSRELEAIDTDASLAATRAPSLRSGGGHRAASSPKVARVM